MKGRIYTWNEALGYYADIHGEICEADEVVSASDARELMNELQNEVEVLRFAGDVQGERLTAEIEQLERLLREARQRTQNLLHRQHGDAIIMNPDEYLRATLSWLDDALAESGHESGQNGPITADQPDAAPRVKRAYYETHEPPHCPTCMCWQEVQPNESAASEESYAVSGSRPDGSGGVPTTGSLPGTPRTVQPAAAHPNALAGEAGDARLGRIAMRFVDRAGDYCEVDPAERICDEFSKAMGDEIERQWRERMARDAATADNAAAQPDAVSTNSVEVSSELVVPFYYRLQDKRDPYRHMNFDPSAWNFILVPTTPGEGVVGYSAADNSPATPGTAPPADGPRHIGYYRGRKLMK